MKIKADDLQAPPDNLKGPSGLYGIPDLLSATAAFMQHAGQLDELGTFNDSDRFRWLCEEWMEYEEARADRNEAEEIDALLDIIVIAWGTLLQRYGVEWARLFANEVARSNLDKVGPGMIKRADGKVQKPEGWQPPRIADLLDAFRVLNVE